MLLNDDTAFVMSLGITWPLWYYLGKRGAETFELAKQKLLALKNSLRDKAELTSVLIINIANILINPYLQ
jgi:hypothetical protein